MAISPPDLTMLKYMSDQMQKHSLDRTLRFHTFLFTLFGAALLAVLVVFYAFLQASFMDDAYIGFTYARNLISGYGFVAYPGQSRLEGVSNIGWVVLLALAGMLGADIPQASKVIGMLGAVLTFFLCFAVATQLTSRLKASVALIMLVVNFEYLFFSLLGMESALLSLLLLACACCCLRLKRPRNAYLLGMISALLTTFHPEGVLVFPLFIALYLTLASKKDDFRSDLHTLLPGIGVWLVTTLAVCGVRAYYFGSLLPNTFYAKPASFSNQHALFDKLSFQTIPVYLNELGLVTLLIFLTLLMVGRGWWVTSTHQLRTCCCFLLASVITGYVFTLLAPQDWTCMPRYFAPYLPALCILIVLALDAMTGILSHFRSSTMFLVCALYVIVAAGQFRQYWLFPWREQFPGYVMISDRLIMPALAIKDLLSARHLGGEIASRRLGVLMWLSDHPVYDYTYGLTNVETARLVYGKKLNFGDPCDSDLRTLWQSRQPIAIVENLSVLEKIARNCGGTLDEFNVHGSRYRLVQMFPLNTSTQWAVAEQIDEQGQRSP